MCKVCESAEKTIPSVPGFILKGSWPGKDIKNGGKEE